MRVLPKGLASQGAKRVSAYQLSVYLVVVLIFMAGGAVTGHFWYNYNTESRLRLANEFHLASAEWSGKIERNSEKLSWVIRTRIDSGEMKTLADALDQGQPGTSVRQGIVEQIEETLHVSKWLLEQLLSVEIRFYDYLETSHLNQLLKAKDALESWDALTSDMSAESLETLLDRVEAFRLRAEQIERFHLAAYDRVVRSDKIDRKRDNLYLWVFLLVIVALGAFLIAMILVAIKRTEEELKESRVRYSDIFEISPEAVITIGEDMNIQLFNQGAERIFGYSAEEAIGRPLELLIPERSRRMHEKYVDDFEKSTETFMFMDKRQAISGLRKDGTEFPAAVSISKLIVGGEQIFTVMLQDITQRQQAEEDRRRALVLAEEANQAKSEFLATMSHELRTPLNAILGFSDMIGQQYLGPITNKKYVEYAADIHFSSEHLLNLVNDILDLSAIEAGKHSLSRESLPVNTVMADFAPIITNFANRKEIEFILDISHELPPLHADRRAIKQILLNIISNAIKFTPREGQVTLRVTKMNGNHVFEVKDTGEGISEEILPKLAKPFVRGESDPHKTLDGAGLGLAIVKSLVELHGGELSIESEVGKGTTVTVMLPGKQPSI